MAQRNDMSNFWNKDRLANIQSENQTAYNTQYGTSPIQQPQTLPAPTGYTSPQIFTGYTPNTQTSFMTPYTSNNSYGYNTLSTDSIFGSNNPMSKSPMTDWGQPVNNPSNMNGSGLEPANMSQDAFNNFGNGFTTPEIPPSTGSFWGDLTDMKGMGGGLIGLGQIGVGAINAYTGLKNYKAVKEHYQNQDALAKADFRNSALATNDAMLTRKQNRDSYAGLTGAALEKSGKDYMNTWGMKTNIG